jgi:hypothetical protein
VFKLVKFASPSLKLNALPLVFLNTIVDMLLSFA